MNRLIIHHFRYTTYTVNSKEDAFRPHFLTFVQNVKFISFNNAERSLKQTNDGYNLLSSIYSIVCMFINITTLLQHNIIVEIIN